MMFLNSVFMLNYPLGLTLIQSSLKALKGGVIEGFNTRTYARTHTHKHKYTATLMHTITQQKQDALLELHQLRKQFVKGKPASVFKARPGDRFPPHRGLFFSAGKEVTRVKVVVRQECNRIWKLLFFFLEPKSSQQVCTNFSAVKITLTAELDRILPPHLFPFPKDTCVRFAHGAFSTAWLSEVQNTKTNKPQMGTDF